MSTHLFISHSHRDEALAKTLTAALEGKGITCWISTRDIDPGLSYADTILAGIENADHLLLVHTA
ncbi:MAG: toll/interleukin-1 receptor domain-containing protein, partial [Chthoniobacteraceae bacterium]